MKHEERAILLVHSSEIASHARHIDDFSAYIIPQQWGFQPHFSCPVTSIMAKVA